ncbi:MAG: DUF3592 domain-containing protein [Leptospiraceae bacterium]|nr:DUF3592 domain-containing protein [Leptospiraceae bacterium]
MKIILTITLIILTSCISFAPKKSEMSSVVGRIIESRAEKKWEYRSAYVGRYDFHTYVKYEYEVEEQKYESDKIRYWNTSYNSLTKAEKAIVDYPLGKEVTVYYRKENPAEAYLEVDDDTIDDLEE